nr:cytochrome c [Neoasaia chiangmaiensis]
MTLTLLLSGCGKQPPGRRLYGPNCGICHHGGAGLPGEIPPLVDRLDVIAQTPEGRRYLADVMLNGLAGPIMANGEKYNFGMPSFRRLDDQQIALILNWLIARGETKPAPVMTPHDIAEARKHRLDPQSTHKERDQLSRIQPVP